MQTQLAINCATTGLALALRLPGSKTHAFSTSAARSSDLLPTALAGLFTQSGTTAQHLSHVFVTTGPGSFTGIRLGLAVAEALKMLNEPITVTGLPTLHACAIQLVATHAPQTAFTVVQDAAGGQIYAQTFTAHGAPAGLPQCLPATTPFTTPVYAPPLLMLAGALPLEDLHAETLFTLAEDPATHLPPQPVYLKPLTYKLAP